MVEVSAQAERILREAGEGELVDSLSKVGASYELTVLPSSNATRFRLQTPLTEIKRTPLDPTSQTDMNNRPVAPITRITREIRQGLGPMRMSQVSQRSGSDDIINVMLPFNAEQLIDMLSVEGVQSMKVEVKGVTLPKPGRSRTHTRFNSRDDSNEISR